MRLSMGCTMVPPMRKATVVASVMLGDSLEYVLRLKDGNEFIARLPRRGAQDAKWWPHPECLVP